MVEHRSKDLTPILIGASLRHTSNFTSEYQNHFENMRSLLTALCISVVFAAQAQNLVPNPSFEDYIDCPSNNAQFYQCIEWKDWRGNAEYFNACSPSFDEFDALVDVPYNMGGYQQASTGNAYAAAWCYTSPVLQGFLYREIMGCQLTEPLQMGETYYVKFKVSWAHGSGNYILNWVSNRIGVRFTTQEYDAQLNEAPITNWAHVYSESIITDSLNWVEVSGSFVADSAYSHLGIGNWFDDANTNGELVDIKTSNSGSYYYVDDVCVSTDPDCDVSSINSEFHHEWFNLYIKDDMLHIKVDAIDEWNIEISDVTGRVLYKTNSQYPNQDFSLAKWKNQILLATLRAGTKKQTIKFYN